MSTDIALRATMNEIEGHRNHSVALFAEAFDKLGQAYAAARLAAPRGTLHLFDDQTTHKLIGSDREAFVEAIRKRVDVAVWDHVLTHMDIEKLMDTTARRQFRETLRENPPEATAENCFATIKGLVDDSGLIFRRGIAVAFSSLDRRFKSHDGFKIGARVVLSYAFSQWGGWNHDRNETIRDIERVFTVLDGKPNPDYPASFVNKVYAHDKRPFEVEGDYFRLKAFKNGNAHLWFTRDDLVRQVNLLLADYYGESLGADYEAAKADAPPERTRAVARTLSFFETPEGLAASLVEEAQVKPGDVVLEPSAGCGRIARAIQDAGGRPFCIELEPGRVSDLRRQRLEVVAGDFLDMTPTRQFDRIVMNPPFDAGRDIDHVTHALRWLKPGGVLVAVMSAGTEYREDARTEAFRKLVERHEGSIRALPALSFAESGTNVNTVRVIFGRGRYA